MSPFLPFFPPPARVFSCNQLLLPSSAPRGANISPILSTLCILPVATGVYPLRIRKRMRILSDDWESKDLNCSLSPLECADPQNPPVTPLFATDPKSLDLKSFIYNRSEKMGVGGRYGELRQRSLRTPRAQLRVHSAGPPLTVRRARASCGFRDRPSRSGDALWERELSLG